MDNPSNPPAAGSVPGSVNSGRNVPFHNIMPRHEYLVPAAPVPAPAASNSGIKQQTGSTTFSGTPKPFPQNLKENQELREQYARFQKVMAAPHNASGTTDQLVADNPYSRGSAEAGVTGNRGATGLTGPPGAPVDFNQAFNVKPDLVANPAPDQNPSPFPNLQNQEQGPPVPQPEANFGMGVLDGNREAVGNQWNPLSDNGTARWLTGLGVDKAIGRTATKETAKRTIPSILKNVAGGITRVVTPGVVTGAGAGAGGAGMFGTGALATTAAPAIGAFIGVNAITEGLDAAGLLPQAAGGTGFMAPKAWGGSGMDAFGWDQQGFENQTMQQGGARNFVSGVMNPLKSIGEIGKGTVEGGMAAGNSIRNLVTNTSNKDRAAASDIESSQEISNNRAAALGQEAAQLKGLQTGQMSYSDESKYNELLAQADDARQRAANTADETVDWELGNQNWFGGGNKFQDAMNASGEELAGQIEGMQDQTLTSAQQADLESLQSRKGEIDRMSKLYDEQSGYWGGTGDFGHSVRNNVTQAKQQLINIAAEMRQAQGNPERMGQLQRDMQFQNDRINQYRQWAESANQ